MDLIIKIPLAVIYLIACYSYIYSILLLGTTDHYARIKFKQNIIIFSGVSLLMGFVFSFWYILGVILIPMAVLAVWGVSEKLSSWKNSHVKSNHENC